MEYVKHHGEAGEHADQNSMIEMPAPTYWPMVMAFGITLLGAGLVTYWVVSLIGFIIGVRGAFGWWHNVIPHEEHEAVPIEPALRPAPILVESRSVVSLQPGEGQHRELVPAVIHPYSAGILGGLAGGAAMAALACLYGLIAQHSIWYPINILAGTVIPNLGNAGVEQLRHFNGLAFMAALVGHGAISMMVGLVYAAILPMFPKYAPFWAGILMPLFWSGLIATVLSIINPVLNDRISWPWFVACQLGFGLVGGFVIARSTQINSMQSWSLADRLFVEAPGLRGQGDGVSKK
jgi:hypothetical protein